MMHAEEARERTRNHQEESKHHLVKGALHEIDCCLQDATRIGHSSINFGDKYILSAQGYRVHAREVHALATLLADETYAGFVEKILNKLKAAGYHARRVPPTPTGQNLYVSWSLDSGEYDTLCPQKLTP